FSPTRHFSIFNCKQRHLRNSTLGWPLGGPCVILGCRLGDPCVTLGSPKPKPNPKHAEGRNSREMLIVDCRTCYFFKDRRTSRPGPDKHNFPIQHIVFCSPLS